MGGRGRARRVDGHGARAVRRRGEGQDVVRRPTLVFLVVAPVTLVVVVRRRAALHGLPDAAPCVRKPVLQLFFINAGLGHEGLLVFRRRVRVVEVLR